MVSLIATKLTAWVATMEQPVFGDSKSGYESSRGIPSMKAMYLQPAARAENAGSPAGINSQWQNLKTSLVDYFKSQSEQVGYTRIVSYHTHQLVHAFQQLPEFSRQVEHAKTQSHYDHSWQRQRFAFDNVMEAELVTVYGEQSPPLHSYDGPAGIIYVLDGELTVGRYSEINNEISTCSGISKVNCQRINRYRFSQGTFIDAISAPIVEIQANCERCIFLNIHLIDTPTYPHYFYYPSYISSDRHQFFTRRVPSEW